MKEIIKFLTYRPGAITQVLELSPRGDNSGRKRDDSASLRPQAIK